MDRALHRRSFLKTSAALIGLSAAGCESSSAPAAPAPTKPSTPAPATPTPSAPPTSSIAAAFPLIADTAARLDAAKARALKAAGVKTVFRYYCHLPASIAGKDLQPEEAKIILGEGLSIGSVFQHFNNCYRTFENNWGKEDAEQALRMAKAAGQPGGSAIYFGVDADWPYQAMRDPILKYFEDVERAFEGSGYSIGVYSNGCICNAVREKRLAEYFWLSGSTGHSGTQAFYNTGRWTLFQNALDVTPPGVVGIDTNIANPATNGYFGQWNDRSARAAAHTPEETASIFGGRRFLNAPAQLMQDLNPGAASLASLRKDQNVRVTGVAGAFTRVLTQEGGQSRTGRAIEGYVPTSSLVVMNAFADQGAGYGLCGAPTAVSDTFKYQNCERATSRLR